jgi:hypothetical protein
MAALMPCTGWPGLAQSFCASDGQPRPTQLLERFINANCDSCWADPATPKAAAGQLALDWVLPGDKGDDAPLSAVAAREALDRLAALRQGLPAQSLASTLPVKGLKGATLRVAHGLPLSGYLGTSIELKPIPAAAKGRQWTAWLALVETLPAGTEGSPVERNLVRNVLQTPMGRPQAARQRRAQPLLRCALHEHRAGRQPRTHAGGRLGGGRQRPGAGRGAVPLRPLKNNCAHR